MGSIVACVNIRRVKQIKLSTIDHMAVAGDSVAQRSEIVFVLFPLDREMEQSPIGIRHRCDLPVEVEVFSQIDAWCAGERNFQRMLLMCRYTQSAYLLSGVQPPVVRSSKKQVPANFHEVSERYLLWHGRYGKLLEWGELVGTPHDGNQGEEADVGDVPGFFPKRILQPSHMRRSCFREAQCYCK